MQIIVTLGRIYDADRLVPVASVQVAGVSYRNLGDAGLEFLRDWAAQGARVRVPTTLNPAGMDLQAWRRMGIPDSVRCQKQVETVAIYESMGMRSTCTCTPYLVGNVPTYGEHIAWSESSAVVFGQFGARRAHQPRGRPQRFGRRHLRPHGGLWLSSRCPSQRPRTMSTCAAPCARRTSMPRSATWSATWWAMACRICPVSTWRPSTSHIWISGMTAWMHSS